MMRLAGASALFVLVAAGCGVGDDGSMMPDPNGRQCDATLTVTGSFVPDATMPAPTGWTTCWPVGMWTFHAAVGTNNCSPTPMLAAQYQMQGTTMPDQNGDPQPVMSFVGDQSLRPIAKYSDGGSGLCEGELDLYSADGLTVWLLKPELNSDNSLTGDGEYGVFSTNQYPL
jgi:hypothetical protein